MPQVHACIRDAQRGTSSSFLTGQRDLPRERLLKARAKEIEAKNAKRGPREKACQRVHDARRAGVPRALRSALRRAAGRRSQMRLPHDDGASDVQVVLATNGRTRVVRWHPLRGGTGVASVRPREPARRSSRFAWRTPWATASAAVRGSCGLRDGRRVLSDVRGDRLLPARDARQAGNPALPAGERVLQMLDHRSEGRWALTHRGPPSRRSVADGATASWPFWAASRASSCILWAPHG